MFDLSVIVLLGAAGALGWFLRTRQEPRAFRALREDLERQDEAREIDALRARIAGAAAAPPGPSKTA